MESLKQLPDLMIELGHNQVLLTILLVVLLLATLTLTHTLTLPKRVIDLLDSQLMIILVLFTVAVIGSHNWVVAVSVGLLFFFIKYRIDHMHIKEEFNIA